PFPRKALEGAALASKLVEIAADILDGRNAVFEQREVRRIPFRKIANRFAAGRFFVFRQQIFNLWAVAVRAERRRQWVVNARGVDADHLHALFYKPLGGTFGEAGRVTEIFLAVGIAPMPPGIDENDIVALDRRFG